MMYYKEIRDGYFIVKNIEGSDDWIIKPESLSRVYTNKHGFAGSNRIWFLTKKGSVDIYDVQERRKLASLKPNINYERAKSHRNLRIKVIFSQDGKFLYFLSRNGEVATRLDVFDVQTQKCVSTLDDLPPSSITINGGVNRSGQLTMAVVRPKSENPTLPFMSGLALIDPVKGMIDMDVGAAKPSFMSCSPSGRYWLSPDRTSLPIKNFADPTTKRGIFGRKKTPYCGVSFEIWETWPVKHVRNVVPIWNALDGVVHKHQRTETFSTKGPGVPIPLDRKGQYILLHEVTKKLALQAGTGPSASDFPEPWNQAELQQEIFINWSELSYSLLTKILWQPDETAFWLDSKVPICIGLDGGISPRLQLKHKLQQPPPLTGTGDFYTNIHIPLSGRKLFGISKYYGGTYIYDGQPSPTENSYKELSLTQSELLSLEEDRTKGKEKEEVLLKDAIRLQIPQCIYKVPLTSLETNDCVKALHHLTNMIDENIVERAHNYEIKAIFMLKNKRVDEEKFFEHIRNNCPDAISALEAMLSKFCDNFPPGYELYWKPQECIGAFGHAVLAYALMAESPFKLLRRYGDKIDSEHETFFMGRTILALADHIKEQNEGLIDFMLWAMIWKAGSAIEPDAFWKRSGLEKIALNYDPKDFADRIHKIWIETSPWETGEVLGVTKGGASAWHKAFYNRLTEIDLRHSD